MIRLTKQADYAIVLLIRMAEESRQSHSARDLATEVHLPVPIVSKVLKTLAREGLLVSHRGVNGGYSLAATPAQISVADIIGAVEGPIAMTECQLVAPANCQIQSVCSSRKKWTRINRIIQQALADISLAEMAQPLTQIEVLGAARSASGPMAGSHI
jgi:FeS assembly SUF system regulator